MTTQLRTNRSTFSPIRLVVAAVAASLVLAACGSDDDAADVDDSTATDSSVTDTTDGDNGDNGDDGDDGATTTAADETTTSEEATTSSASTETPLPGNPIEGFTDEGDVLAVMGVAHDDVLNIREAPGTDQVIIATAAPDATNIVATGEARELPNSIWYEVTVDGTTGWASFSFLAFLGTVDDATAEFLDGSPPSETETLLDLGELVAAGFASEDPPSTITQVTDPVVGDLGEVIYDVIGLGDDAVAGYRLHIFAAEGESGESYVLKSIERTTFCTRGLEGELCA